MRAFLLSLLILLNTLEAFDTLRGAGSSHHKEEVKEKSFLQKLDKWYLDLINDPQPKPNTRSNDVIIIHKDRSISFNGQRMYFGTHIDECIKVLGDDYRILFGYLPASAYLWDDLGISVTVKSDKGDDREAQITNSFNIQLITFLEMFPRYKNENIYPNFSVKKDNGGGL